MRCQKATEIAQLVYGFRDKRPNLKKIISAIYPEGDEGRMEKFSGMLADSKAKMRGKKAAEARGDNG